MIVLAGDVGGTNARLALIEADERSLRVVRETKYVSRDFPGLAPIVRRFCEETATRPERACYGVACPLVDQRCSAPNLPWTLDARALASDTGIARTTLINDFDAVGYGVGRLGTGDLVTLQPGTPHARGPIALIGAGTGLGQGFLLWDGDGYRAHPSEGGHAAFAARTALEWGLAEFLRAEFGHASWERVLSGAGLVHIYRYLVTRGIAREEAGIRAEMEHEDPAAVVSRHALAGSDAACMQALDVFVSVYGRRRVTSRSPCWPRGGCTWRVGSRPGSWRS